MKNLFKSEFMQMWKFYVGLVIFSFLLSLLGIRKYERIIDWYFYFSVLLFAGGTLISIINRTITHNLKLVSCLPISRNKVVIYEHFKVLVRILFVIHVIVLHKLFGLNESLLSAFYPLLFFNTTTDLGSISSRFTRKYYFGILMLVFILAVVIPTFSFNDADIVSFFVTPTNFFISLMGTWILSLLTSLLFFRNTDLKFQKLIMFGNEQHL